MTDTYKNIVKILVCGKKSRYNLPDKRLKMLEKMIQTIEKSFVG